MNNQKITIDKNSKICDILKHDINLVDIFYNFNIDYCCNGHQTLEEVCKDVITFNDLINQLLSYTKEDTTTPQDTFEWNLNQIAYYILDKHHTYIKENSTSLINLTQK